MADQVAVENIEADEDSEEQPVGCMEPDTERVDAAEDDQEHRRADHIPDRPGVRMPQMQPRPRSDQEAQERNPCADSEGMECGQISRKSPRRVPQRDEPGEGNHRSGDANKTACETDDHRENVEEPAHGLAES